MQPNFNIKRNLRFQNILFFSLCLCNALPLLLVPYFPTVDGPAHIYNAHLLQQLMEGSELVKTFHRINTTIVPNWSATVLLVILRYILPSFIAEKIMTAIYVIGLPLAFRNLLRAIKPESSPPWLIIPFTYTFMLFMGFYNFNLGMVFFCFALAFWIKHYEKPKPIHFVALFLYTGLLYFSHIFVLAAFVLSVSIFTISGINKNNFKRILSFFVVLTPWIILTLVFILTKSGTQKTYITLKDHLLQLRSLSLLITFNYKDVEHFTKIIFYTILILCVVIVSIRIVRSKTDKLIQKNDVWLLICATFLFLYLLMPDSDGSSGYVSIRIALMFFMFLVIWITVQKTPLWINMGTIIPILIVHACLLNYYTLKLKNYNPVITELKTIETKLADHKILLPLNYSNDWYTGHFSNYLGSKKHIIILDNYESDAGYFPLLWNKNQIPHLTFGNLSARNISISWMHNPNNGVKLIDYILLNKHNAENIPEQDKTFETLHKFYTPVVKSGIWELYELKK